MKIGCRDIIYKLLGWQGRDGCKRKAGRLCLDYDRPGYTSYYFSELKEPVKITLHVFPGWQSSDGCRRKAGRCVRQFAGPRTAAAAEAASEGDNERGGGDRESERLGRTTPSFFRRPTSRQPSTDVSGNVVNIWRASMGGKTGW